MDASIAAAWIGAGVGGGVALLGLVGTVATSIVNSNNTRKATERTVEAGTEANRATLVAAREDRLWEKRCAAYEETLADIQRRQEKRRIDITNLANLDLNALLEHDSFVPQDPGVRARLVAYASDAVLEVFRAINDADAERLAADVELSNMTYQISLGEKSGTPPDASERRKFATAKDRLKQASDRTQASRERLIQVVRDELRSRPEAATVPPALPAKRRKLLRHKAVDD